MKHQGFFPVDFLQRGSGVAFLAGKNGHGGNSVFVLQFEIISGPDTAYVWTPDVGCVWTRNFELQDKNKIGTPGLANSFTFRHLPAEAELALPEAHANVGKNAYKKPHT